MGKLSRLSAYARPEAHLTRQTSHGAIVTCLGATLALILFIHELSYFWKLHRVTHMSVDTERRHDLPINMDIVFARIPCAVVSLDVLDVSGTSEGDASHSKGMQIHKHRLDANGKTIGKAEYHTPQSQFMVGNGMGGQVMNVNVQEAMNHLQDMEDEEGRHEGCRITGTMLVKRVAGRLHLSVHQNMIFKMMPQLLGAHHLPKLLNMSHHVHELSFGPHFHGMVNPLDGFERAVPGEGDFQSFQYFVKVVPTEYYSRIGRVIETHQYSVSEYVQSIPADGSKPPSIDIMYDVSPIVVVINDAPPSILHFLVRLCAVIGGVFAVTRMADRWVHWAVGGRSGGGGRSMGSMGGSRLAV
ncbi:hypothetical protein FOA52_002584 [Chlamydomonas sp. UWO 241]|nr:hypothetical protein FOA52_002584 [Chlamydomonas sp. UWO 241]